MSNAQYIGRVGGLAVALGVGMAIATTPGVAWADDTGSASSEGSTGTAGATRTSGTSESEGTSTTTGTTPETAGTSTAAGSQTDAASTLGSGSVDTSKSGTSASSDASVRQVPPGVVLSTGGDLSTKSSRDNSVKGEVVAESTTDDSTEPKRVADATATTPEAPAPVTAPVTRPIRSDKRQRPADKPNGAPGVDANTLTATGNAVPSRPDISPPADTVVDGAVHRPATQQAVTALTARTFSAPQTGLVARQAISAAPEEPTPPRVSGIVLGVLASAGLGPLTPVNSPLGLALAAVGTRPRPFGQPVAENARSLPVSSTLTSQSVDTSTGEQRFAAAAMSAETTAMTASAMTMAAGLPADTEPTVNAPDDANGGTVTGSVNIGDLDGNASTTSTYSVTGQPANGTVAVDQGGNFTYTPTQAARLTANQTSGDTDMFTVRVSEGQAAKDVHVTVPVSSASPTTNQTINTNGIPSGVAVTPDGTRTYVANQSNGTVSVINSDPTGASYNTVVKTITVGGTPSGVAVAPDGNRAYVSNANGTVAVIDTNPTSTKFNTVIKTVTVGGQPSSVAITPDSKRVYVTKTGSTTVSMIDTTKNYQVTNISVGFTPARMAFAPDGSRAYLTNRTGGTVAVLDTKPGSTTYNKVVKTITVGGQPSSVALTPNGKQAYVSNANGTVSVINTDPSSGTTYNTVVTTISVGPSPTSVQITRDASLAYVANSDDTVSVIDTKTNTVNTVTIDSVPETGGHILALTPDGRAYVTDAADRNVRVVSMVHVNTAPQRDPDAIDNPQTDEATGAVKDSLHMSDIDGDKLTYTTASDPAYGAVTYDAATGTYTYTPTAAAREQAARSEGEDFDRFTVTVSDGQGGTTTINDVTVTISPKVANTPPPPATTTTPIAVGANPAAVAVSGPTHRVYVVNAEDSTVSVIDTTSNKVVATIPVGNTPTSVAVSPDGTRAYVTSYNDNTVSVINTTGNIVIKTIEVPYRDTCCVTDVAVSPDGSKVYVTNELDNTVSVINTATNTISGPYDAGFQPSSIAVSPDGRRLYLANYSNIMVLDTATMTPIGQPIYLGSGVSPKDVAVNGNRLYTVNYVIHSGTLHSSVSVIDVSSSGNYTVVDTIAVRDSAAAVALSPDGSRVYVSHEVPGTITVIDTGTNEVIGTITVDTDAVASGADIAVAPDGRIYFTDWNDNTVYAIAAGATELATTKTTITVNGYPNDVAVSGDYVYVVNESDAGTLWAIDPTTNTVVGDPISVGIYPTSVVASEQGDRVYVADYGYYGAGTTGVAVIDTDPTSPTYHEVTFIPITVEDDPCSGGAGCWYYYGVKGVAVSSDGSRVYAFADDSYVSVIDTATKTVISRHLVGSYGEIAVSEDGTRLYAWSYRDFYGSANTEVDVYDTATMTKVGTVAVKPEYTAHDVAVAINPDGTRAYAAVRDPYSYDYKLSVIDIDPDSSTYNKEIAVIHVPSSYGVVAVDVALNNDGSRAYVLNHDGKVVVIDTATNHIIGTFTVYEPGNYDNSGSIAVGSDGTIYVTDTYRFAVYAVTVGQSAQQM